MRIDLLLVVEDLGVGFERGRDPLTYLDRSLLGAAALRGFPPTIATRTAVRTAICPLSGLRRLACFPFYLRECCSNKFTIHLILLQQSKTGFKPIAPGTLVEG